MTTTEHQLRVFLESSAARTLARVDPTALLASMISQSLEVAAVMPADTTPAGITTLAHLPAGQREVALHQGLIAHDTDTAEQIADILLRIGPALAQITSGRKHSEVITA
ncbi:hypothetical protein K2Z83_28070, partial [Oscillochloris sp. ZM17-4]|uniref:hypothetical protein n=1 Tax=Oscillochloris sp. ZM17-4 TaxID=2866714 RepID=UPI001C735579